MSLELTTCPSCGAPAEVTDEGCVTSTSGQVHMVRVRCARRHWFLLDAQSLARAIATEVRAAEDRTQAHTAQSRSSTRERPS